MALILSTPEEALRDWTTRRLLAWLGLSSGRDDGGDVFSHEAVHKLAESPDFYG